jgi:hypothetical protein
VSRPLAQAPASRETQQRDVLRYRLPRVVRSGHEIGGPLDAGRRGKAGAAALRLAIPLDSRLARLYCELKGAG